MDVVTQNVARYVREKRINILAMSRDTGIPYAALYTSLADKNKDRELRGKELIAISKFLGVDPMEFAGDLLKGGEKGGK